MLYQLSYALAHTGPAGTGPRREWYPGPVTCRGGCGPRIPGPPRAHTTGVTIPSGVPSDPNAPGKNASKCPWYATIGTAVFTVVL